MEIIAIILFFVICSVFLYLAVKVDRKRQKEYFKDLNDCIYDSLKRAFNDIHD